VYLGQIDFDCDVILFLLAVFRGRSFFRGICNEGVHKAQVIGASPNRRLIREYNGVGFFF